MFYKTKGTISKHNYCSGSCAAIVNNQRYPKYPAKKCRNTACGKMHRRVGSPYCSIECGKKGRFKYTESEIVEIIKAFYKESGRAPAKREMRDIVGKCAHMFGSWNNAVVAAGLEPHRSDDHRMYRRTRTKARDGHVCDSVSEATIDNWLTKNKISHERNAEYPNSKHKADWVVLGDVFIEYFGLAKDSPRYDRAIKKKREICKAYNIKLMEIYPKDLYPVQSLKEKLGILIPAEKKFKKMVVEIKQEKIDFKNGEGDWKILHSLKDLR
ncbi:MAG: hypothetical protein AAB374_00415 [Patescibacteria group bacterium]